MGLKPGKLLPSSAPLLVATLIVALPLLYVLSLGPAAVLWHSEVVSGERLDAIYRPLFWMANQSPFFQRCLYWYIGLWIDTRPVYGPGQPSQ
jgi:hypothetical protein